MWWSTKVFKFFFQTNILNCTSVERNMIPDIIQQTNIFVTYFRALSWYNSFSLHRTHMSSTVSNIFKKPGWLSYLKREKKHYKLHIANNRICLNKYVIIIWFSYLLKEKLIFILIYVDWDPPLKLLYYCTRLTYNFFGTMHITHNSITCYLPIGGTYMMWLLYFFCSNKMQRKIKNSHHLFYCNFTK